jgi:hypothetical protein
MEKFKRAQDLVSQKTKLAASFEQTLEAVLDFYLDKQDPLKKAERNIHKSKKLDEAHSSSAQSHNNKGPAGQVQAQESLFNSPVPGQADIKDQSHSTLSVPGQVPNQTQSQNTIPNSGQAPKPKRHIPTHIQHQVRIRDQHQCTHRDQQGARCPNTRWLEVHHIHSFAQGGSHDLDNLTTLCSAHHKQMHH